MRKKTHKERAVLLIWSLVIALGIVWVVTSLSILKEEGQRLEEIENLERLVEFYQNNNTELQTEIHELKKGKE